ncbi:MAG: amidohydrolase family protein [Verrucomicrobiales bacterium]|nr:amidohydrolase family protein [Verrucomicrobiales bacterium]
MKTYATSCSRRALLKRLGSVGALAVAGTASAPALGAAQAPPASVPTRPARGSRRQIEQAVMAAPLIDTHEHLIEESDRLQGAAHPRVVCDDWALLFSHYLNSDLLTSGMPTEAMQRFLSADVDPLEKWALLKPWWQAVKNTGYARAVRIAIRELYGVDELTDATVGRVQEGYEKLRRPGFYRRVLNDLANIESCQVNCLTGEAFKESAMPTLLMQDISIVGMFAGPNFRQYAPKAGIEVRSLADWHRVIRWWFDHYAQYAVAVKSQNAYSRDIDYERVAAEQAEPVFNKVLQGEPVSLEERKRLEDHLFWEAVDQATTHHLPVKLHTGFYAGQNSMPLERLARNPGSATDLCRRSPDTRFVFMHIGYPYYEEMIAVAKQWTNAHVDMCWSWIINPIAAKDFLKKFVVTAPANKVLPFGADYIPVEPVLGHAVMARRGVAQALSELVAEGWLSLSDALELVDPILHGNARRLFDLEAKTRTLAKAPWARG